MLKSFFNYATIVKALNVIKTNEQQGMVVHTCTYRRLRQENGEVKARPCLKSLK